MELLSLQAEPACWRYGRLQGHGFTLKPDSYTELGSGDYMDSFFIEVDMGSEGSRALDTQLRHYVAYHDSGIEQRERGVFPKTLWLAPDVPRVQIIEDCIGRLPARQHELFQVALFGDATRVVNDASNE